MSKQANLRNVCRQIEQEYVDWDRPATHRGFALSREWPAIGELGRHGKNGVVLRFVTTNRRTVYVNDPDGVTVAEVPMRAGMAEQLYVAAQGIADQSQI